MKRFYFAACLLGALTFGMASCSHKGGHDEHEGHNHSEEQHDHEHEGEGHEHEGEGHEGHEHEAKAGGHSDEIILTPEQAKRVGVVVKTIEPADFHQVVLTSGQIEAAQGDEVTLTANMDGVVSFRGAVTEGMQVAAGNALFSISASRLPEGDPGQRARIAYEAARKEYDRATELVKNKIISEREFNAAEQAYRTAKVAYEAVGRSNGGQAVASPISGFVKNCLVKAGDFVSMGQTLATVTQTRKLYLRAEVSERYFPILKQIQSANFKTSYDGRVYELKAMNGRVLSVGKATGQGSYLVPVVFEFDNKGDVVPGSFVEVYLISKDIPNAIALPKEAITEEQGVYYVYRQLDEEGYQKQPVKIGNDNGREVQILSGVNAGDRIVVKEAIQVKLAAVKSIPGHTHNH